MYEIQRKVQVQLHVKLGQVLPDELRRTSPADTGVHFDGGVGQVLWERGNHVTLYSNFNARQMAHLSTQS